MSIWRIPTVTVEMGRKSHASTYADIKNGLLTKPVKLGLRSVGIPDYEVKAIVTARIAGKTDAEIKALVNRLHAKREQLALELV